MNKPIRIQNADDLRTEIRLLQAEKVFKEKLLQHHWANFKESLKPARIFSDTYQQLTGAVLHNKGKGFAGEAIKTGLALWLRKLLFKAEEKVEQRIYAAVDAGFDKLKDFLENKFTKPANSNAAAPQQPDMATEQNSNPS